MSARPEVVLNDAISLDGKLSTAARGKVRFTSDADRRLMDELRAKSDAVLIGAGTLRAEDPPLQVKSPELRARRVAEGRPEALLNVVLSASLSLNPGARFFSTPGIPRIVVTVEEAREDLAARLAPAAEIWRVGRGRVDVAALLDRLAERGVSRLLVEGGGKVNASFFEAGLVDEIRLTLAPVVIGGGEAPTLSDGEGFLPG